MPYKDKEKRREYQKQYHKQYYVDNKEELNKYQKEYKKQYRAEHKEGAKEHDKQYYIAHKEEREKYNKQYAQTPAGKERDRKSYSKRHRLGFNPFNEPFPKSEAHHINTKDVIYIPKKMHRSIYHCLETRQGMGEINTLAIRFLLNNRGEIRDDPIREFH